MRIDGKKVRRHENEGLNIIIKYFKDMFIDICDKILLRENKCNILYCNNIIILKYILKLYNNILHINKTFNKNININDIIGKRYLSNIYNIYLHVINKHENLRCLNIFNDLCNNNNCEYNIRNRNNNNNNILDIIHSNIIHYKYNINNQRNDKYNKFITQINNIKEYDLGRKIDFYGYISEREYLTNQLRYKYSNLKHEMLYPLRISYGIWNASYIKASMLSKTPNIKHWKAKNDILFTKFTKIYSGEIITRKHILAIILYTDNDELCYNFRKTFREYDEQGQQKMDK